MIIHSLCCPKYIPGLIHLCDKIYQGRHVDALHFDSGIRVSIKLG